MQRFRETIANTTTRFADWTRAQKVKTVMCRECDAKVSFTETVCNRCGASDPARVPMSAVTAIFSVSACAIIAALTIAY